MLLKLGSKHSQKLELFCEFYQIYESESEIYEYENLELWGGIYFVGVIKFMDRLSAEG